MAKGLIFGTTFVGVIVGAFAFYTWLAMLLFGAVHTFLPVVPPFSFWQTAALLALVRLFVPGPARAQTKKSRRFA